MTSQDGNLKAITGILRVKISAIRNKNLEKIYFVKVCYEVERLLYKKVDSKYEMLLEVLYLFKEMKKFPDLDKETRHNLNFCYGLMLDFLKH